ncbi:hypothetical protein IC582_022175 [Cucumis melo]
MNNHYFSEENFIYEVKLNLNNLKSITWGSLQKEIPAFISLLKAKNQINNQTLEFVKVKKSILNNLKLIQITLFSSASKRTPFLIRLIHKLNGSRQMGIFLTSKFLH